MNKDLHTLSLAVNMWNVFAASFKSKLVSLKKSKEVNGRFIQSTTG